MLYGYPPFVSKSRQVTRQKIANWRTSLRFPSKPYVSREAQDFIASLICAKEDRLGSKYGASEIKAHPFFRSIDFDTIHTQTPPFVPELNSLDDTKYFEDDIEDAPIAPADVGAGFDPNATRDPMLNDKVQGEHLLQIRKNLAFQVSFFDEKEENFLL